MSEEKKWTIAVDFDGVIHSYTSPWESAEVIPDPPVPGVIDWLNEMTKKFKVVIFTTRGKTENGRIAVMMYLRKHGYKPTEEYGIVTPLVTAEKPPALVYIDDRGYRFDGVHFPTAQEIHAMKPWNK